MAPPTELERAAEVVRDAWARGFEPDPDRTVVEWSEEFRVLTTRESSRPGPKRFRVTPYLREIAEVMSVRSGVEEVVAKKGAQIGFTDLINDFVGYVVDQAPAPMLWVFSSEKIAKRHSRQKLQSMIDHCTRLRERIAEEKSRRASNTMILKEFPGGILALCGANAPSDLRSFSAKYVLEDELNAFPLTLKGEGDPVLLAERAARDFAGRKIVRFSTPSVAGRSAITKAYEKSDKRRYFVPCPHCGEHQVLFWQDQKSGRKGIRWEGEGEDLYAWHDCAHCGKRMLESSKQWMLEHGVWKPEHPERSHRIRGYWISALYAPVGGYTWTKAVREWNDAQGNTEALRIFVNQTLAEDWNELGDPPPWEDLFKRREFYGDGVSVPQGGLLLTAGVDVQQNRIECEVVAFGKNLESWSIDHKVFDGDPNADEAVWQKLDDFLARTFKRKDGALLPVRIACVDTGYASQSVYHYCRVRRPGFAYAVKGEDHLLALVGTPTYVDLNHRGKRLRRGVMLWHLGVSVAKSELYGFLRKPEPKEGEAFPRGFCHFPTHYGEEYFRQLTAEQLAPKRTVRNVLKYEWVVVHERNEVLDCRVYARAGAAILGADRFTDEDWQRASGVVQAAPVKQGESARGGFWSGWRRRPT